MARPSRQSYEKARREQLKREKRERKAEKKAAVAAARAAGKDPHAPDEAVDPSATVDAADETVGDGEQVAAAAPVAADA